ncbi:homeodomain-like protein [Tanacetum coccineum]
MKDKMVYKGNNVIGALMNVPIFVGTFSVVTDFVVLENIDEYHDEGMGNIIFGEPFLRDVRINAKRFEGMITIYNDNDEVTYQRVSSHPRFKYHTNEQCNKIPPLLKDLKKEISTNIVIMEYLVNISKRRTFWSLNEDILKINDSDNQYAVSMKEDTAYPCLHSPKTTKETSSIRHSQRRPIRRIGYRTAMTQVPVLQLPDFNETFVIETDVSGVGIGVVLQQKGHPVAFLRKDSSTKTSNLVYRITTPAQMKWLPKLMGFDYEIMYKKGAENVVVDALSRIHSQLNFLQMGVITLSSELYDRELKSRIETLQSNSSSSKHYSWSNGQLLRKGKLVQ